MNKQDLMEALVVQLNLNKRFDGFQKLGISAFVLAFIAITLVGTVHAAALTNASNTLGDSRPSTSTSYTFQASGFTASSIKCIQFQFANNPDMTGGAPTGFTSTTATLTSSTVITVGSWTVAAATNGTVNLTNATGQTPSASGNIVLSTITNGSVSGTAYYEKVSTYTDTACTASVDNVTIGNIYTTGQAVSVTVNPILSFAVGGLASGTVVNGATSNFTTTAGTIPFGTTATTSTNAVGAQALTIATNSGNGYNVTANYTGPLSNGTHPWVNHTGTNAAPTAFSAAGTENFAYTTAGEARFSTNLWSGFSTTPAQVANSATGTNSTTVNTAYQIGLSTTTQPGNYSTTVVYTATPLY